MPSSRPLSFTATRIYPSSPSSTKSELVKDGNLVILLHGLGDTAANFVHFGVKLQLPNTSVVAIQAPYPLADLMIPGLDEGHMWFPSFDLLTGEAIDPDSGIITRLVTSLFEFICDSFLSKDGITTTENSISKWDSKRIFVLGFSQGGSVALELAASLSNISLEFGGIVSISGPPFLHSPFLSSSSSSSSPLPLTALLVTHGELDNQEVSINEAQARFDRLQRKYPNIARFFPVPQKAHSMPKCSVEMRVIMEFLSRRLYLEMTGLPKGAIQIN